MIDWRFYVGPLGDLVELPDRKGPTTPLQVVGGTHTSLTGAFTRDVYGHLRSWSWSYDGLTVAQLQYVEALQLHLVPGPLYLLDPRRPNRLPVDLASGGSVRGDAEVVTTTNNAVAYWRPLHSMTLVDQLTLPARRLLKGCLRIERLDEQPVGIEPSGPSRDARLDIPVMGGEPLETAAWACGVGELTASFTVHDRSGAPAEFAVGEPVTLSPTEWRPVPPAALTVPDVGARHGRLRFDSTGPPGEVHLTALSCHRSDEPEDSPYITDLCGSVDVTGGHRIGGGGPRVVAVDNPAASYLHPGLYNTALTLTERN